MSTTPTAIASTSLENLFQKAKAFFGAALFLGIHRFPRLLQLHRNEKSWTLFRIVLACLGAAIVVLPLSLWNGWITASTDKPQSGWAQRLQKAHVNAVENLVIFATLVLTLNVLHHSTASTVLACAVYFWARLAHAVIYWAGIPVLRTLSFAVGFLAQVALVLAVFGKM